MSDDLPPLPPSDASAATLTSIDPLDRPKYIISLWVIVEEDIRTPSPCATGTTGETRKTDLVHQIWSFRTDHLSHERVDSFIKSTAATMNFWHLSN
jgi:hypothetical protein